jgi:hypothetical protein
MAGHNVFIVLSGIVETHWPPFACLALGRQDTQEWDKPEEPADFVVSQSKACEIVCDSVLDEIARGRPRRY